MSCWSSGEQQLAGQWAEQQRKMDQEKVSRHKEHQPAATPASGNQRQQLKIAWRWVANRPHIWCFLLPAQMFSQLMMWSPHLPQGSTTRAGHLLSRRLAPLRSVLRWCKLLRRPFSMHMMLLHQVCCCSSSSCTRAVCCSMMRTNSAASLLVATFAMKASEI